MKYIGAHVSISGGVQNAPLNAKKIGARAFAMFTKNQRQWNAKPLEQKNIDEFNQNLQDAGIEKTMILPHDSYLINLGNPEEEKREKSYNAFLDELNRCELLGLDKLNFHPGSHLNKISEDECIKLIAESMNMALENSSGVKLVIENTAGQGSNIGYDFTQIAKIIEKIEDKSRVGVCIDTCHTFSAGYDLRDEKSYSDSMGKFEKIIGFEYLSGVHLNDSKVKFGSRVDRHHSIGRGELGLETFRLLMNDSRFDNIPMVLETIDESIWDREIELLYSLIGKNRQDIEKMEF